MRFAQLLPLSVGTSVGRGNETDGGVSTSSMQFIVGSRSRIWNEPALVLHSGTMYSCPTGGVAGWASGQLSTPMPVFPDWLQSVIFTGNTTGRNWPPVRRAVTAVASAAAERELIPTALPKNVPNVRVPPTNTPCAPGGMTLLPTLAAWAVVATTAPLLSRSWPAMFV